MRALLDGIDLCSNSLEFPGAFDAIKEFAQVRGTDSLELLCVDTGYDGFRAHSRDRHLPFVHKAPETSARGKSQQQESVAFALFVA